MRTVTLVVAALPFLWSCGKPASHIAAKVNGSEIPVEQLRRAVAASTAAPGEAKPTPAQVMDTMIDEALFAQKAIDLKLDRQPHVRATIESMRTRTLAQAYMQHLAVSERQDPHKVKAFYRDNPALFEQRRIYRLLQLAIEAPGPDAASLRAKLSTARTLGDVAEWLKGQGIAFTLGAATKAAEEIPMELLPRLASMQDGQIEAIDTANAIFVIHLLQSQGAPLSEDQSSPLIERFLRAPEYSRLVSAQLKNLRDAAHIEYVLDPNQALAKQKE